MRVIEVGLAMVLAIGLAGCTTNQITVQTASLGAGPPLQSPPAASRDVPAAHLTADDVGVLPPLGQTYRDTIPLLGRVLRLPPGDWQVAAEERATHPHLPPTASVGLVRVKGNTWSGVLVVGGNTLDRPSATGFPLQRVCAAATAAGDAWDRLYGDAAPAVAGGDQDCADIGFLSTATWYLPDRALMLQSLSRSLAHQGLVPPATGIFVAVAESDGEFLLTEQLWLNPDLSGIPPDPEPRQAMSAWVPRRLTADPAKSAYVAKLVAWSGGWRRSIRAALDTDSQPASVAEIQ